MATRRDQLQSYQFLLQRVVSALVYRKTDPAQSPFRKAGGAVFAGVMLSILALAVTVAISWFTSIGKNVTWWEGGYIVLEEETGTKYVVFPKLEDATEEFPQKLYPVTNFASAALLAGTTDTIEVSQNSLTGEGIDGTVPPRGMPVGIYGAPDSLPAADHLITESHASVCTKPQDDGPLSLFYVGTQQTDGQGLSSTEAILLAEDDAVYLVDSNGYKHLVPEPDSTLSSLGISTATRATVAPGFAKALPTGENLSAPQISGIGDTSTISGHKVGDIFEHTVGANTTYLVALREGAAPITELQALLIKGETGQAEYFTGAPAQEAASATSGNDHLFYPDSDDPASFAAALPLEQPTVPGNWHAEPACVSFDGQTAAITVNANLPIDAGIDTAQASDRGEVYADRIVIPPGRGMLVRTGEDAGAFSLIVAGQNYPITRSTPNEEARYEIVAALDALQSMKYPEDNAAVLSSDLLSLIPSGPNLNAQDVIATAFANDKDGQE